MPSAATAKLVKQASAEALDPPLKQGIVILDHKIRNLEKRKSKLEGYRDLQAKGKPITSEQSTAVAKFNEVIQTLKFASDLRDQFNAISIENAKQLKKQARKEALERQAADLALIKEVLTVQSVLLNFGLDPVRNTFLAGSDGACKLTDDDLKTFDEFHFAVSLKSRAEGGSPIDEQLNAAAELFQQLIEGKTKEYSGSTYAALKAKIKSVHECGYFDKVPNPAETEAQESPVTAEGVTEVGEVAAPAVDAPTEVVEAAPPVSNVAAAPSAVPVPVPQVDALPQDPAVVLATTFHNQAPLPHVPAHMAGLPQAAPVDGNSFFSTPAHPALRAHDVITQMSTGGSFHFLQDSELDDPDLTGPGSTPHHVVAPIPTQTYTNPNFPTQVNPPPASAVPMYQHHSEGPPPVQTAPHHHVVPEGYMANQAADPYLGMQNPQPMTYQQMYVQPAAEQRFDEGERSDEARGRVEQASTTTAVPTASTANPQQAPQASQSASDWSHQVDTSDWNESEYNVTSHSDGYRTQRGSGGGSRDRGDRGDQNAHGMRGGRKGHRGQYSDYSGNRNRDGYQGGSRGGGGGGSAGGYDRNSGYNNYRSDRSGDSNNVYQNGYKDGSGGGYRSNRPPRDGDRDRPQSNRGGGGGMNGDRPQSNRGGGGGMNRGGPRGPPRGGNPRGRGSMRGGGSGGQGPKQ